MPLVDYGSSGESGDEENEAVQTKESLEPPASTKSEKPETVVAVKHVDDPTIFSSLPKPSGHMTIHGNVDNLKNLLLNNKTSKNEGTNKKGHVKITIPSLSDFENDDIQKPETKKVKPSTKQAGLFSVLPPPKNLSIKETKRQLIPHVVKNQINKAKVGNFGSMKLKEESSSSSCVNGNLGGEEDEDSDVGSTSNSYFGEGISSVDEKPEVNVNFTDESCISPNLDDIPYPPDHAVNDEETAYYPRPINDEMNNNPESECSLPANNETLELDDKAMQILCGGKRKRNQMPVNIIDLSGEEIMPDSKEWLLKQLTEEKKVRTHSHRKQGGPSVQSRRKHQITYLAFQAKAQELELQNQWSQNRMTRRQTQSKYGF